MSDALNMSVSPICQKNGKKFAYVQFLDETRMAEGKIPDCTIVSNQGFTEEEVQQLERYMKEHLEELKVLSANLNVFDAMKK